MALALLNGGYDEQTQAAMAIIVWSLFILVAVSGLGHVEFLPMGGRIAAGALGALVVFTLFSTSWATDDGAAFNDAVLAAGYLGLFLLVLTFAPQGGRPWLAALAIGLAAVAFLGLGSRVLPDLFPDAPGLDLLSASTARLSYPLNYWNGMGACLAVAIILLAWFGAEGSTRLARAVSVAAIPAAGLALFLTSSRGGVGALAIGLIALVSLSRRRALLLTSLLPAVVATALLVLLAEGREAFVDGELTGAPGTDERREMLLFASLAIVGTLAVRFAADRTLMTLRVPRRTAVVVAAAAVALALGGVAAADPAERWEEFKEPLSEQPVRTARGYVTSHLGSGDGGGRYQLWQVAWRAFEEQPVRGIGAGGFEAWWTQTGPRYQPVRDAHSLYLETLAQLGIAGGILLLSFVIAPVAAAARRGRELSAEGRIALAVVAATATSAAIDWTWELPAAFALAVVALAVAAVAGGGRPSTSRAPRAHMGAAALLGIAGMALGLVSYVSASSLAESRAAFREGDRSDAIDEAREARAAAPWAAAPRLQLALLEEEHDLSAALAHIDQAIVRAREDWRLWLVAARLRIHAGDIDGGRRALAEAKRLNPRASFLPD